MPTSSRSDCWPSAMTQLFSTMSTRKPCKRDAAALKDSSIIDRPSTQLTTISTQGSSRADAASAVRTQVDYQVQQMNNAQMTENSAVSHLHDIMPRATCCAGLPDARNVAAGAQPFNCRDGAGSRCRCQSGRSKQSRLVGVARA